MPILQASNITHFFETEEGTISVIKEIDLKVEEGEFLAIIGPSGCGKSTLLRILSGLTKPKKGQVIFNGQVLTETTPEISFIFQNFAIFPWLTVEENIAFPLKMIGKSKQEIKRRVTDAVHDIGLKGFEKAHPKELSGGMKQRVGIGRALAVDSKLILADEPFSALDEFTADDLREDLLKIWKKYKKTIIIVTHLVSEAIYLSDRIITLTPRPGKIEEIRKITLSRPRNKRSEEFFKLSDQLIKVVRP